MIHHCQCERPTWQTKPPLILKVPAWILLVASVSFMLYHLVMTNGHWGAHNLHAGQSHSEWSATKISEETATKNTFLSRIKAAKPNLQAQDYQYSVFYIVSKTFVLKKYTIKRKSKTNLYHLIGIGGFLFQISPVPTLFLSKLLKHNKTISPCMDLKLCKEMLIYLRRVCTYLFKCSSWI